MWKVRLGVAMVVVTVLIGWAVHNNARSGPAFPSLVPYFGIWTGLLFLALQGLYYYSFKIKRGWLWMAGGFALYALLFPLFSNTTFWEDPKGLMGVAEFADGAACSCGLFLGMAGASGKT